MSNPDVSMTLDEAVEEVLGLLTGLDMTYSPDFDRYRAVTRLINRALRLNAQEHEWSYYSDVENVGLVHGGDRQMDLRQSIRMRIIGDDAVRLVDPVTHNARVWIYILPRDALHKYAGQPGIYCSVTRSTIEFSRNLSPSLEGLEIHVPVMREPIMFNLPDAPELPTDTVTPVSQAVRDQLLDFDYPDVVIARAAHLYAQTDPVMQPRVQTLEAAYKDLIYSLTERDDQHTDSPFMNEFFVPISNGLGGPGPISHSHPHSDYRR